MATIRPTRDGGAAVWLDQGEPALLRGLIAQVIELIGGSARVTGDALEDIFDAEPGVDTPEDPVLARLLPDAYTGDPDAAREFRRYTESSLRTAKRESAQAMLDTLPGGSGEARLNPDQARAWLRAINDVRLAIGTQIDVTEDYEDQLGRLSPEDPRAAAFELYGWLGAVQSALIQAVTSPIMLTISRELYEKIVAHARADHPDEACGVIAGPAGSDRPERFIPMINAERSPTFYRFDSAEQLRVWREMDDRDEEPVVIYHSHTATEAYPSRTDITYASEPNAHYVLVSTRDEQNTEFRSYRILDGQVTEESVAILAPE
jgi:[CysO sulfur-carrier protein]-S-L-cysteine hydrolase